MNKLVTTQALGWLIGLLLLFSWNLQAEVNPSRNASPHPVRSNEFFKLLMPAEDLPPLNLTATVGVPFQQVLPYLIPMEGSFSMSVTGLPDNGLRVGVSSGFPALPTIEGTPLTSGVMNLTLVNTSSTSGTAWRAIIITVTPPPLPPPPLSLTAAVGTPFRYEVPITQFTGNVTATGLPANGLSLIRDVGVPVIIGIPQTAGVMSLTLNIPENGIPTTREIIITVDPLPQLPPLSLTAAVGKPFRYQVIITQFTFNVSVTGLPANGLSLVSFLVEKSIEGIPLTAGVMSLTLNTTERTIPTTREIIITVDPPPPPPPPISLSAMVGTLFSYQLPITQYTTNTSATGLPANGLSLTKIGIDVFIRGTPITAGVLSVTIINTESNSAPVERVYIITVSPPLPPISLTATVGVPFIYQLPYLLPLGGTTTLSVTGLLPNGLSLQLNPGGVVVIKGTPLTSGVSNLTLVNSQTPSGLTAWRAITITVNPAPGTPPTNNPPVAPNIASQTATVGVPYFQNTPSFTDPDGQAIAVQAFGLPPGLSYTGTASGIVAGTPTTAGVYSVSLVGTDLSNGTLTGGLSATAVYTITVSPVSPGGGTLTLLAPTYNCTTGAFTFNTSGGDGSPITFSAIGITGPTTNPNQFVDTDLRTAADAPLITLSATQNGILATYVWNIRAVCPVGPGTPPVNPPGSGLSLLAPTYNCATGAFTFNTSGGDGSVITFSAIGITGPTTNPNQFVDTDLRTAADAPLITLSATQNGTTVTYVWNIRAQCPVGPGTPPVNPPVGSALVLLPPTYNCATGSFTFNTSGGNGTPIEYRAVPGITDWTTNLNQFVDEGSRTANDVQPFLLEARQNGFVTTFVWDLKAACGRARLGAAEPERRLRVVVLGNPVVGETVQVEVGGAEGQPLRVALTNLQGRLVSEERIGQAAANERISLKLGRSMGIYLLQVSSPDQTKVVRVLKTE